MELLEPYYEKFLAQSEVFMAWIDTHLFTLTSVVQLSLLAALIIAAKVLSFGSSKWLDKRLDARDSSDGFMRLHLSHREMFFLLYAVIFFWVAVVVAQALGLPFHLLKIISSLATAWAVIRLTSSTIKSPFWARIVAIILWTIAALNILGWLDQTIEFMRGASFSVGEIKLTMLMVVKSLLAFAVLLWVVRVVSGVMQRGFNSARGLNPSQKVLFFKLSNIGLYAIAAIIGLNIVGLDLTALAVFSGALGLGIGFGLQKVFSNLISGIILLLDKSVKPGDVIAIDGTYGWVNSLGARCVSVLTRDGKEHLIPNETLITEQVENWSYSNEMIRVHVPVGVSYNEDMQLVKELLFKSIEGHKRILENPKPNVLMVGFGDSSVDFEIRLWMKDPVEGIANLKSDVYFRVWELFKENDVEIPFPQRDVHLDVEMSDAIAKILGAQKEK